MGELYERIMGIRNCNSRPTVSIDTARCVLKNALGNEVPEQKRYDSVITVALSFFLNAKSNAISARLKKLLRLSLHFDFRSRDRLQQSERSSLSIEPNNVSSQSEARNLHVNGIRTKLLRKFLISAADA